MSPLVTDTIFTSWPSFAHFAAVPPAFSSASSGCAPKTMMRSFAGGSAAGRRGGESEHDGARRRVGGISWKTPEGELAGSRLYHQIASTRLRFALTSAPQTRTLTSERPPAALSRSEITRMPVNPAEVRVRTRRARGLATVAGAEDRTGEQIYKEMCARCHGAKGEGTKKYEHPLTGDKSVAQLAGVIDRTMPEDDPDKLDAEGSKRVAAVHPRRVLLARRAGEAQPAARRTVAAHGQAVPQQRRRPRRQLPAVAEARRQAGAARRVLQLAELPATGELIDRTDPR